LPFGPGNFDVVLVDELTAPVPSDTSRRDLLVERAMRGEKGAFGRLYERHIDGVYNYMVFRVGDRSLAEDLTQDVFVNAYKGIGRLGSADRFEAWLMRIAHNRLRNFWREKSSRPVAAAEASDSALQSVSPLEAESAPASEATLEADEVLTAAAELTDLQQQVIALRFVAGLTILDTAAVMGRSTGAVKNLQHHALAALRRQLARQDDP
jgi:RNA polymerase sigma-70 factor (ECF subfamily)